MQNRYVGDVADFGKHGLLRHLSGETSGDHQARLTLGLVWYLHHDQRHGPDRKKLNYDGKHTGYLVRTLDDNRETYRECDPELWEKLRDLMLSDARCVHCAQEAGVLPEGTAYYDALLNFVPDMKPDAKREFRKHWLDRALRVTEGRDIVCVDPDNGVAVEAKMYGKDGPKYVYPSDLKAFWERGQSLVVYHHLGREGKAPDMARAAAALLRSELVDAKPIPLLFHRGSARVFFVVAHPNHERRVERRIGSFLNGPWGKHRHFERVI